MCRASELKEELNRLGLPSTGSRQQLEERLMHHYETAQDAQYEALAAQVALLSMPRRNIIPTLEPKSEHNIAWGQ